MAYAAAPVEPKRRPAVVTVACWLLCLVAAAQVLSAVVTLSQLGAAGQAYREVFAETPMKGAEDMFVAMTAASAVGFGLLLGVGYVVLAVVDGRGRNPARIITWIVAGLSICFSVAGLVLNSAAPSTAGTGSANGAPSAQEIQQALDNTWPGWYQPLLTTIGVVSLVALVATVILLALPAANRFFRKPEQPAAWQPPVPPPTA
jgi:hypothetical protein